MPGRADGSWEALWGHRGETRGMDETRHEIRMDRRVLIPMRDGVRLSGHLTRPVGDGGVRAAGTNDLCALG